jgi:phosphohistidine phosphatase
MARSRNAALDLEARPAQFLAVPLVLDLVRHAQAEPPGPDGDASRALTTEGRASMASLAAHICASGSIPTRIFASPLARANQSARILAAAIAPGMSCEPLEALKPDSDPASLVESLALNDVVDGHVLLVGHLPQLDDLYQLLTGTQAAFPLATLRRVVFVGGAVAWRGLPVLTLRP